MPLLHLDLHLNLDLHLGFDTIGKLLLDSRFGEVGQAYMWVTRSRWRFLGPWKEREKIVCEAGKSVWFFVVKGGGWGRFFSKSDTATIAPFPRRAPKECAHSGSGACSILETKRQTIDDSIIRNV